MLLAIMMLSAAPVGAVDGPDLQSVPVGPAVGPDEILVPVSTSVSAVTWDWLEPKPAAPVHISLACIVWQRYGVPGACVPADMLPSGAIAVDWPSLRHQEAQRSEADMKSQSAIRAVAGQRISQLRLQPRPDSKQWFVVRLFDAVISPEDARPINSPTEPISLGKAKLVNPIRPDLVRLLYPSAALRNDITARVAVRCRIIPRQEPLCRDAPSVEMSRLGSPVSDARLSTEFGLATYQLVSTIRIEPLDIEGREVVGKDLVVAIRWTLPE